ncbi:MAG: TolB family protein [Actinomycetota bacterium]
MTASLVVIAIPAWGSEPATFRVSTASDGGEANHGSSFPSISADGRFVAFSSPASNLTLDDVNGVPDVFVHDLQNGTTSLASVSSDGLPGDRVSRFPSMSADGRFVAFESEATNLVPRDTNGAPDIFVRDLQAGVTVRVSVKSNGTQVRRGGFFPKVSADGNTIGFQSFATKLVPGDTNGNNDSFVHSLQTGETTRVSVASDGSEANGNSFTPRLSADGHLVSFASQASNLVSDDGNARGDVFLHDLHTRQTTLVSVASDGGAANGESSFSSLSPDGRFVAFTSLADDLVLGDTNGTRDVFVRDLQTGETTRASVASGGAESDGPSDSSAASLSADGRFVSFTSFASNLVVGDTNEVRDAFVHDRQTRETMRVSVDSGGIEANMGSRQYCVISADGRFVAFPSDATNLVSSDLNDAPDIFERGPLF